MQEAKKHKLFWRLYLPATILSILSTVGCDSDEVSATYYRLTPMVIRDSRVTDVALEVKIAGSPTAVELNLASTGRSLPLNDEGSGGDVRAGDGIYTITLRAADVFYDFTPDDVNRNFVGYLRLYLGSDLKGQYNIFADILTGDIPPAEIKIVSSDVQYTEHLVNMVDPTFFDSFRPSANTRLTRTFYRHFDDNYDFINIIFELSLFKNRRSFVVRNNVQGIGHSLFDNTATYGSGGRLRAVNVFPVPTFFDGAEDGYQHELAHQWINYLHGSPLESATNHWPLSDIASGVMGTDKGPFNFDLLPFGPNYLLVPNYGPKFFTDLSLYLMGFIPASDVSRHFVFDDQSQTPVAGGLLLGPVTNVTISDIIGPLGSREPDYTKAQKKFRVATIIVSKDGLLSDDIMRLYDYFSARAEETRILPYSSGFVKGQTKPFYLSTHELGRLDVRIKRHILIDASRDGGVWWFPQAGPFDPLADHQGKALADHLRSLGHKVVELPRPYTITAELLSDYDIVIRSGGMGEYDAAEISAYQNYVGNDGNVLLLADHSSSDDLALSFGLQFEGITLGENLLTNYLSHQITRGLGTVTYIYGSGLTSHPGTAQVLGRLSNLSYLDLNDNGAQDPDEPSGPAVLGAMTYGEGRIVFCGDVNLWETIPEPLMSNVLKWFTEPNGR